MKKWIARLIDLLFNLLAICAILFFSKACILPYLSCLVSVVRTGCCNDVDPSWTSALQRIDYEVNENNPWSYRYHPR